MFYIKLLSKKKFTQSAVLNRVLFPCIILLQICRIVFWKRVNISECIFEPSALRARGEYFKKRSACTPYSGVLYFISKYLLTLLYLSVLPLKTGECNLYSTMSFSPCNEHIFTANSLCRASSLTTYFLKKCSMHSHRKWLQTSEKQGNLCQIMLW